MSNALAGGAFFGAFGVSNKNAQQDTYNRMADEQNTASLENAQAIDEALAHNMLKANDAAVEEQLMVEMNAREAEGEINATAGGTGQEGSGVTSALNDVTRNSATAQGKIEDDLDSTYYDYEMQQKSNWAQVDSSYNHGQNNTSKLGNLMLVGGSSMKMGMQAGAIK